MTPLAVNAVATPILRIRGLEVAYGRIAVLHGIDIDVDDHQLVALIGANGAGKTTLMKTIAGLLDCKAGRVEFLGRDITGAASDIRVRAGVSLVPEGRQVFAPLSVEDNLRLGSFTRRGGATVNDMDDMYRLFPVLKEKRRLPAGTLSGGQQQMLAIARALIVRPKLLLLDEPSMGLAPLLVTEIFEVIKQLRHDGMTVLLVEQNAELALAVADHAYVLETGRVIADGAGSSLLDDDRVRQAYLGM